MFVTNPELKREYALLQVAAVYSITSELKGARRLTLLPLESYAVCGNPLIGGAMLLGIVPVSLPAGYMFSYELETEGKVKKFGHILPVCRRYSIWEWFVTYDEAKGLVETPAVFG